MDRQKLLTIFGVAWLSAALLTWFLYAKTKAPKTEETVKILAAVRDLPAGTKLGKADLKLITVVRKDSPSGALSTPADALDRALLFPVGANEPITAARLASLAGAEGVAATIDPGMRAVSVAFTDASGASGLILPRSHVDVLYTKSGSVTEAITVTVLENITVLSVGRVTEVPTGAAAAKAGVRTSQNQTATLMVTPEQAQKLELAKNQGKISLALRNPLDNSTQGEAAKASTLEHIDPMILYRSASRGKIRVPPPGVDLKDKSAWAQLVGDEPPKPKAAEKKEPPKPKLVVDVYRGEKHVQEVFHEE
jgi:pilus assembly protein CpaB